MAAGVLECIGKSNITAAKPETLLFQRKDVLYQRNSNKFHVFGGARLNCANHHHRKQFPAANPRWRLKNRNSYYFRWYTINQMSFISYS